MNEAHDSYVISRPVASEGGCAEGYAVKTGLSDELPTLRVNQQVVQQLHS
jgi:hypothetical protein